jgi:serine protease AprX
MRLHIPSMTLALAFGLASTAQAQSAPTKVDEALTQSLKSGCVTEQVIIRTARGYRAGLRDSLEKHGDVVTADHPSIEAITAEVHCEDLSVLAGFSEVLSISKNAIVRADGVKPQVNKPGRRTAHDTIDRNPEVLERQQEREEAAALRAANSANVLQVPLFETLGIRDVRRESSGTIGIAVIDSGIAPAFDFENRITHFYDFTGGRVRKTKPSDAYGHGTHVAGLIGSRFVGVAPGVRLVGLRVLDKRGQGQTSDVLAAIEFAVANRQKLGINAISLALGHPVFEPAASDPLVQAVESAVRAGLVVITSSGNFGVNPKTGEPGYAGVVSPGNAPSALTVGAINTFDTVTRRDDRMAPYSSRGPSWYDAFAKPDIAAPGHNMLSVAAKGSYLRKENETHGGAGNYMRLSGTSMASGVASGVVALILEANPGLTPNALKAVVEFTAIPVKDGAHKPYDAFTQGTGGINGSGAVKFASAIDTSQPVGAKWLLAGMPFKSTIGHVPYRWAQTILWGPHHVIGDGILDENRIAWATNIVWGSGVDDYNIVWGNAADEEDNIVWGTSYDEDDNIVWGTNIVWSTAYDEDDNIVWGTWFEDANIVWGTNIVWGNSLIGVDEGDNIVWGTSGDEDDNIVWGTMTNENIVWADLFDHLSLGVSSDDDEEDNIVWGTGVIWGDGTVAGHRPERGRERKVRR